MPAAERQAMTAVPSAATATCGSVAFSPDGDSASARPQRPDVPQVAAITRPRFDQAAVTAERPSMPMTGLDFPRPGMFSATALPNAAPLRARLAPTSQPPCDSAAQAAVALPLAPTLTCGSACVCPITWAWPKRRLPTVRAAACMPASSVQMTIALPSLSNATSALGSASSLSVRVWARRKRPVSSRLATRRPKV
jgi:hypothetical protein